MRVAFFGTYGAIAVFVVGCGEGTADTVQEHHVGTTLVVDTPDVFPTLKENGLLMDSMTPGALRWFFSNRVNGLNKEEDLLEPNPGLDVFSTARDSFNIMFGANKGSGVEEFDSIAVEIDWHDFDSVFKNMQVTKDQIRGVIFYHGYDTAKRQYQVGICRAAMTYNKDSLHYEADDCQAFYRVKADGTLATTTLADWQGKEGKAYFDHVKHRRAGPGMWNLVKKADADVEAYTMPYEYVLREMGLHNVQRITPTTTLVITCFAESVKDASGKCFGVRHHLLAHLRNGHQALLDKLPHNNMFEMRAADLGTPCPPRCKKFKYNDISRLCAKPH